MKWIKTHDGYRRRADGLVVKEFSYRSPDGHYSIQRGSYDETGGFLHNARRLQAGLSQIYFWEIHDLWAGAQGLDPFITSYRILEKAKKHQLR